MKPITTVLFFAIGIVLALSAVAGTSNGNPISAQPFSGPAGETHPPEIMIPPLSADTTVTDESGLLTVTYNGIPEELAVGDTARIYTHATLERLLWDVPVTMKFLAQNSLITTFVPVVPIVTFPVEMEKTGDGTYQDTVRYHCRRDGEGSFQGTVTANLPDESSFRESLEVYHHQEVLCIGEDSDSETTDEESEDVRYTSPEPQGYQVFRDTRSGNYPLWDAAPREGGFVEFGTSYYSYEFDNLLSFQLQGEYAINDLYAVGAQFGYNSFIPMDDMIDSYSGMTDPMVTGWRSVYMDERTNVVGGGRVSVPAGSEEINEGHFDFGVFSTGRRSFSERLVGVAQLGVDFLAPDFDSYDRDAVLSLQGGVMYDHSERVNLIGEFIIQQKSETSYRYDQFSYIKGGAGYQIPDCVNLRLMVGTGLDEEGASPFFELKVARSVQDFSNLFSGF